MNNTVEHEQQPASRIRRTGIRAWWQSRMDCIRRTSPPDRNSPNVVDTKFNQLTLEQFSQEILRLVQGRIADSTHCLYAFSLRALARVVGNLPMASLGPYHFELFLAQRLNQVSAVRVNMEFRALRALFSRAVVCGMVSSNPMKGLRQVRVSCREPRALTREEFARLLSVIDKREFRALVILAVCTAMRAGELASLRWTDVDLQREVIHLTNREGFQLKGLRGRDVPLSLRALQALKVLPRRTENVFVSKRGRRYTVHAMTVRFKEFVRLAKLPEEIHLHSLRHTAASWMVERNVPLPYVRDILGHTAITTTMIYAHSSSDHLRRSVRSLDGLIAP